LAGFNIKKKKNVGKVVPRGGTSSRANPDSRGKKTNPTQKRVEEKKRPDTPFTATKPTKYASIEKLR